MVDIASGAVKGIISAKKESLASRRGYAGGVRAGVARAIALTEEERIDIARIAAKSDGRKDTRLLCGIFSALPVLRP